MKSNKRISASTPPPSQFGQTVARLRKASGLSVRELARKAGVSHVMLLNLESGRRYAGIGTAIKILGILAPSDSDWVKALTSFFAKGRVSPGTIVEEVLADALCTAGLHARVQKDREVELDLGNGRIALLGVVLTKR